ncbi:hypothetical protein K2173_024989 [Erythroxylum novogranatense]|uniref:RNA polymerase sigma-70 domain-containing protein n=1 Tax=Erythroxylum novogranatense TaxID=1862640 RepID=A0AAV8UCX1_9ROSI|nr:hypothetical protein K2173_024989 [Erythroxylum novogranatense]
MAIISATVLSSTSIHSSSSAPPISPSARTSRHLKLATSDESLILAAAAETVALATAAVGAAREAVELSSQTGMGSGSCGLKFRRKKRRKRRKGFQCLEVENRHVVYEPLKSGYLSRAQEANFCLCLQDQARLEVVRKKIVDAQEAEPTSDQLAKALMTNKSRVDKILCKGRESAEGITSNYRKLVASIATAYRGKGLSFEDLIQEGTIGLLRGAERFDPKRGCKLSTYSYWWIKEAIITAVTNKGRIVRLPGSTWEMVAKITEAKNALRSRLNRVPSYDEIAEMLNLQVSTVRLGFERSRYPLSLDRTLTDQGRMTLQEIIPGPDETNPEKMVKKQLMKLELEKLLQTLDEREERVLRLRFGLNGQTPLSCEETGRLMELSRERVRQITVNTLLKLRKTSMDSLKAYVLLES